ncbi:unnamed protein product [Lymnaea stagnalis]|uniref:Nucleoside diphosphate-linked moiety X motif 19 n=1 Tax=Lymnaea stagnalis TaxID=6523 RepID=A0AAV2H9T4_LYMST
MAAVLKHWREAATLILVTSTNLTKRGTRLNLTSTSVSKPKMDELNNTNKTMLITEQELFMDNFEVLMLKRSGKSKFMPNVYVFPGGVAVDCDFSSQWLPVFNKLGSDVCQKLFCSISVGSPKAAPMFTRQRDSAFSSLPSEVAFRICAIRETFEESGVLLAQPAQKSLNQIHSQSRSLSPALLHEDANVITQWRERVNKDPNEFLKMCLELDLVPEVWSLYEWSNWLTPTMDTNNNRRFDTAFYICCVDHKPAAAVDSGETVNAVWASPSSLLCAHFKQKGVMAPPQVYELSRLVNLKSASDILILVSEPNRERVERWMPIAAVCQDAKMSIMPGDDLYPQEPVLESQELLTFKQTLAQLSQDYPNQHRIIYGSQSLLQGDLKIKVSIPAKKGHILPDEDVLDKFKMNAQL